MRLNFDLELSEEQINDFSMLCLTEGQSVSEKIGELLIDSINAWWITKEVCGNVPN